MIYDVNSGMKKKKSIPKKILKKLFYPPNTWAIIKSIGRKKKKSTVQHNPQLQLYTELLPGDFLHYGYFDDPSIKPEAISLQNIYDAQLRYAELIVDLVENDSAPVLDAGCGMGGLLRLLSDRGLSPVGLTPDQYQIDYLQEKYPALPLVHAKFEDIPLPQYQEHFGTVIHSESLQYMSMEDALRVVDRILMPGGKWIVCDYFRTGDAVEKSGFYWDVFQEALTKGGYKIVFQQDITENIRPTLAYVFMLGNKFGFPLLNFLEQKLAVKQPVLHQIFGENFDELKSGLEKNLKIVDPETFANSKMYKLLAMERI